MAHEFPTLLDAPLCRNWSASHSVWAAMSSRRGNRRLDGRARTSFRRNGRLHFAGKPRDRDPLANPLWTAPSSRKSGPPTKSWVANNTKQVTLLDEINIRTCNCNSVLMVAVASASQCARSGQKGWGFFFLFFQRGPRCFLS